MHIYKASALAAFTAVAFGTAASAAPLRGRDTVALQQPIQATVLSSDGGAGTEDSGASQALNSAANVADTDSTWIWVRNSQGVPDRVRASVAATAGLVPVSAPAQNVIVPQSLTISQTAPAAQSVSSQSTAGQSTSTNTAPLALVAAPEPSAWMFALTGVAMIAVSFRMTTRRRS